MPARTLLTVWIALAALTLTPAVIVADPPDEEWLSWTVKDCKDNTIDLSDHENKTIYVVVFTPGNEASCTLMRGMAAYVRGHANKADRVLGFCSDDTGCDAVKLHIRQEEWKKRVDAWNAEQATAREAAQQAGQTFSAAAMPDYLNQIKDEIGDPEDFQALIDYHVPFKTCQRCGAMWTWLSARMSDPLAAPRLLKINASGHFVQEWSELPNQFSVD